MFFYAFDHAPWVVLQDDSVPDMLANVLQMLQWNSQSASELLSNEWLSFPVLPPSLIHQGQSNLSPTLADTC